MKQPMRKLKLSTAGILLSLSLCWGVSPTLAINDTILAIVNDDIITLKDMQEFLRAYYLQLQADGKSPQDIEAAVAEYEREGINHLIENKLLLDEANRKGMTIRNSAIDEKIDNIRKRYPSDKAFVDAITKDGLTISDLRKRITDQFKMRYIVEKEVKEKIFVNPQEVTDYYRAHLENFTKPERAQVDSIFIPYDADKKTWAITAQEALSKIRSGTPFSDVAKEFSKAPAVGTIEKGTLIPTLEEAIFRLQEGEVSSVLEADNGAYIFMLVKKIPTETVGLDKARADIYDLIFQKKFKKLYQNWLAKLRKAAYVEIKK